MKRAINYLQQLIKENPTGYDYETLRNLLNDLKKIQYEKKFRPCIHCDFSEHTILDEADIVCQNCPHRELHDEYLEMMKDRKD